MSKRSRILSVICALTLSVLVTSLTPAEASSSSGSSLKLASASALVVDTRKGKTLYAKNPNKVVPIASLTKLMTALVVLDSKQNLNEVITVDQRDRDTLKHTHSRIKFGTKITRRDALSLALMSSENRMASALGRHYPGGKPAFVKAMNRKAKALKMTRSRFADPTGLSTGNVSTANDLAKLVKAAYAQPLIRQFTQTENREMHFNTPSYVLQFVNTNPLVRNDSWNVRLSKTGYTDEAGRCLVMRAQPGRDDITIVLLDSVGKRTPMGDANRIRQWLEGSKPAKIPVAAKR
ncbi:MAG: D-alanyl-D-alanine endopeptidase [Plesiomonas sp.]|uniref:D-alanyl-D-alanine endopeptidase n=1 Tax=Plesiomonas sp. TaxID=2486279 RepID=UPI003F3C1F04